MSVKLKITVTKEILEQSKNCSHKISDLISKCAVALAVRDIFPNAEVYQKGIICDSNFPPDDDLSGKPPVDVLFPGNVFWFIHDFDHKKPHERIQMPEISFEIEIPDKIIDRINIDELKPLLQNHPTLELIEE